VDSFYFALKFNFAADSFYFAVSFLFLRVFFLFAADSFYFTVSFYFATDSFYFAVAVVGHRRFLTIGCSVNTKCSIPFCIATFFLFQKHGSHH